jgi:hypothetical protein
VLAADLAELASGLDGDCSLIGQLVGQLSMTLREICPRCHDGGLAERLGRTSERRHTGTDAGSSPG